MKSKIATLIAVLVLTWVPTALGQTEGNVPPSIDIVRWAVLTDYGLVVVYDRDAGIGSLADVSSFLHHELDMVIVTVELADPDWVADESGSGSDDKYYLRLKVEGTSFGPPIATPIAEASDDFFPEDGYAVPAGQTTAQKDITFVIPEFLGRNQERLAGVVDYDVFWFLRFDASNDQSPEAGGMNSVFIQVQAVENPSLATPNPPTFADAGADRTVPIGQDVILDGRRTFDAFNVGFDVGDNNVFEKDTLTFSWEWVSGPVRVDPVQRSPQDAVAVVRFEVPNDPDDPNDVYVYRLTVDDNVNALPSTDTVRLRVVESLPAKHAPRAVIVGPANPVPVGSIVTLCGRRSCDLDCDPNCGMAQTHDPCVDDTIVSPCDGWLHYRWLQTNELGQPLELDQVSAVFQPLAGLDEPSITWQALVPGTYYFRLLVDDGDFQATTTFSVTVIDTQTQGETVGDSSSNDSPGDTASPDAGLGFVPAPALCGAGLLPVAIVPLALVALRRRYR